MRKSDQRSVNSASAKITAVSTTGLLKGELMGSNRRKIPIQAWIGGHLAGETIAEARKSDGREYEQGSGFEISLDFNRVPTDWMIAQNQPIVLKRNGKNKQLHKKGWWPGSTEAAAFRSSGLRRLIAEGRLQELPEIALKGREPRILRDSLLECFGMLMDTFMSIGDDTIMDGVELARNCLNKAEGMTRLVIERNSYLCEVLATLTTGAYRRTWIFECLDSLQNLLKSKRVRDCLIESMATPHLACEQKLWKSRIELVTGAVCHRLYMTMVDYSTSLTPNERADFRSQLETKKIELQLLSELGEYIYTWRTKSNMGFLLYQLTGLLAKVEKSSLEPVEEELEEIKRNSDSYCYEQAALCMARLCWQKQQREDETFSEVLYKSLREIQLALSGYDYANNFGAFNETATVELKRCWERPYGSHHRRVLRNEIIQFSNRARALVCRLAGTYCTISQARKFQEKTLEQLRELLGLLYVKPQDGLIGQRKDPPTRWLIISSRDLPQCWIYRALQKKEQLERLGHEARIVGEGIAWKQSLGWTKHLLWADAVIVCRQPYTFSIAILYALSKSMGKRVYYEVDDVIFSREEFPPALQTYGHTINEVLHRDLGISTELYRKCIELSDGVIVSTEALKKQIVSESLKASDSVFVLPNLMLPELREIARSKKRQLDEQVAIETIRIVFASGTLAHKQCWNEEMAPALAEIMKKHETVELLLLGSITVPGILAPFRKRIRGLPYQNYRKYLESMSTGDIGVFVLEQNIATDCKSAIKWMEYSACGLASIVSPTDTHTRLLSPGTNVLFAESGLEWLERLEYLVANQSARRSLAKQAHKLAIQSFGDEAGNQIYREFVAWARKDYGYANGETQKKGVEARKRLLIVNVFFRPESHGGANSLTGNRG